MSIIRELIVSCLLVYLLWVLGWIGCTLADIASEARSIRLRLAEIHTTDLAAIRRAVNEPR